MAPYVTSTMIFFFREQRYSFFFFSMKQLIVTDISCFTFSDLENRDSTNNAHIEPTCLSKKTSLSVTQLRNVKKQIADSPCGAFPLTGWGICQKRCFHPSFLPRSDQTSHVAVQQCKILMNAFLNSTLKVVYMMGFTALFT